MVESCRRKKDENIHVTALDWIEKHVFWWWWWQDKTRALTRHIFSKVPTCEGFQGVKTSGPGAVCTGTMGPKYFYWIYYEIVQASVISNYIFQLVKNWTAKKDLVKSKKYVLKSKISNATSDWLWFYCGCHNYAVHLAHYSIWRVFISKNSCTFIKVELIVINASIQTNEWEISSLGCFKTSLILICKQNWRFKDTFVTFLALNQHK